VKCEGGEVKGGEVMGDEVNDEEEKYDQGERDKVEDQEVTSDEVRDEELAVCVLIKLWKGERSEVTLMTRDGRWGDSGDEGGE
jgi:hypothetical protein